MKPLTGIHHVTAITGDPQRNVNFYSGVLGLRLVKKTVNFDDPGSYHLYYGDRIGTPGTLITFFAWPGAEGGNTGVGEPVSLSLSVPAGSLPWWKKRLGEAGCQVREEGARFGQAFLAVADPDGIQVELIEVVDPAGFSFWSPGGIEEKYAIRNIHSVTLSLQRPEKSTTVYKDVLNFSHLGSENGRERFSIGSSVVDVISPANPVRGNMGAGAIHHVAFRTPDDASQSAWLARLSEAKLPASPVMDRNYFHSIYFREPGHVLFEIATDPPGMTVDEPEQSLGESLKLPREFEEYRTKLELALPPIASPHLNRV